MIHIFLNKVEVFKKMDSSIKIIKENPVLTKSGSYSLNVIFPLAVEENRKFFGDVGRLDAAKKRQTYNAEISNDATIILAGSAVVTSITDEEVSVQLLAGNSNANFWNNAENDYIDEYDYNSSGGGDIVKDYIARGYLGSDSGFRENLEYHDHDTDGKYYFNFQSWDEMYNGYYGRYDNPFRGREGVFAFCKVWDENMEVSDSDVSYIGNGQRINSDDIWGDSIITFILNCVQPNLSWVIREVIAKRGYELQWGFLDEEWFKDIYIASARQTLNIADALPHWKVKDFIMQVEKLFNGTFVFDDALHVATFVKNESFDSEYFIEEIEDAFEVNIEEDNGSTKNIGFENRGEDWLLQIDEDEYDKYEVIRCSDYNDMMRKMSSLPIEKRKWCFFYVAANRGGHFVWNPNTGNMDYIDVFGPIDIGGIETEKLKIVPCRTCDREYLSYYKEKREKHYTRGGAYNMQEINDYDIITQEEHYYIQRVLRMTNAWGGYNKAAGSLYSVLTKEDEENLHSKEDLMQIFLYTNKGVFGKYVREHKKRITVNQVNPGTRVIRPGTEPVITDLTFEGKMVPVTNPSVLCWDYAEPEINASLVLQIYGRPNVRDASGNVIGHGNYLGERFENPLKTDNNVEFRIRFLAATPPDTRCIFHIRGKRYACKKIEYDINEDGIDQLMTGYFVEILN